MINFSLKKKFLFFISFNVFYVLFYLYTKHDVGIDTSISEWIINYKGGFTRRGLGGEINIFFANLFSISLRDAIFYFQSTFHVTYLILVYFYLKKLNVNIFQLFALFSPLFLLYPVAELEALGRKEILIFVLFTTILFFSDKKFDAKIPNALVFIFFPVLCFIWEQVILFAPFFAVVLIIKNKLIFFKDVFFKLILIFSSSIISIILIFLFPLSLSGHSEMCNFLQINFNQSCYSSANLLIKNTIYFDTLYIHDDASFFPHYFRYIMIFFIGFLPLHLAILKNNFLTRNNFITKNFSPLKLYALLYIPVIPLFIFGYDWGRWIHIMYSLSVLLYFFLIRNSIISNEFHENIFSKIFFKKKSLTILIFFIFAFFWNPKTVITGDIATNSLYKIVYNSVKIIFDFDNFRILQDNIIIKFHKNYLE